MPEVILLSQIPLPYSKIGSWSTLYDNYLTQENLIDYVICEKPDYKYENIKYGIIKNNFIIRIIKKIIKNNFLLYQIVLKKLIEKDKKYIIQIVDNSGLAKRIHQFLVKKNLRKQCYIQFFYHGFVPLELTKSSIGFYQNIDELILLTKLSFDKIKKDCDFIKPKISILNNGINTKKFFRIDNQEKLKIKNNFGFNDLKIFLWCSQDRPKKGLHIVLEAWKTIYENNSNIILLVIGCEPRDPQNGVKYLGRIPNKDLPIYYQIADVYLFPTLCEEGFGMSLTEALHCGCYCIASAFGGVPEVLNHGKWGVLVENPNFVSEWIVAIQIYLDNNNQTFHFPDDTFSSENWNKEMNLIIENAKNYFSK